MFVIKLMRKRKYGHLQPQDKIEDFMIEDIENYYDYKKRNPNMTENAVESEASIHNLVGTAKISCSSLGCLVATFPINCPLNICVN